MFTLLLNVYKSFLYLRDSQALEIGVTELFLRGKGSVSYTNRGPDTSPHLEKPVSLLTQSSPSCQQMDLGIEIPTHADFAYQTARRVFKRKSSL